jgi:hypothetical protein
VAVTVNARSRRVCHSQRDRRRREHLAELREPHPAAGPLAADIVEAVLACGTEQGLMLDGMERPRPASWEEQRIIVAGASRQRADNQRADKMRCLTTAEGLALLIHLPLVAPACQVPLQLSTLG